MESSPAGPDLTPQQWMIVGELCRLNPNLETAEIRRKINSYLAARRLAATQDDTLKGEP